MTLTISPGSSTVPSALRALHSWPRTFTRPRFSMLHTCSVTTACSPITVSAFVGVWPLRCVFAKIVLEKMMNSAESITNTSTCTNIGTLKKASTVATTADGMNQMETSAAVFTSANIEITITAIQKNGI